jgi:protein-S-isoprenylcysteine O-methyltransferase Ste14
MMWLQMAAGLLILMGGLSLLLFGSAGRWDLPFFQAYIGIMFILFFAAFFIPDKDLIAERRKPGPGGQDVGLRRNAILVMAVHWAVAGVDVGRLHWSDTVPFWLQVPALAGIAAALSLSAWAVRSNRFFSSVARIQRERGHVLVTAGPYQYIRHPGYAASIGWFVLSGVALGSWLSVVPAAAGGIFLFLRRLRIEEALLLVELEGYREYAQRVPYRLVPGIW